MKMPEGPEVKLSADLIKPLVINKPIIQAGYTSNSRYSKSPPEGYQEFINEISSKPKPTSITDIQVRGKFMYWSFDDGWYMFSTFGMSGQWSLKEGKHPCFYFTFNDNSQVYFNDPRHFGTIKFAGPVELKEKLDELGWDPLAMSLDKNLEWVRLQLSRNNKPIVEVLMNQAIFAGVGNYIRAEALYSSKLSPWRLANSLSRDEIHRLCQSIVDVMQESYQHQGATIHTYKTAYGEEGNYSTLFKVYGQKKDPSGHKIIKQPTPDKRTIHWCPDVQI